MLRPMDPLEHVGAGAISFRAVRPDDKQRIVKAFKGLERESVYRRFFTHRKELEDEELRRVTECDGASHAVLVATTGSGEHEAIVGMGSYVRSGAAAEVAFAVEEDFQRRGIASRLLRELADLARAQGIERFEAEVLSENTPMLDVFRRSSLPMRTRHDHGVVHVTLLLQGTGKG
jgi:GNAT superfamily N-acetyltransferase